MEKCKIQVDQMWPSSTGTYVAWWHRPLWQAVELAAPLPQNKPWYPTVKHHFSLVNHGPLFWSWVEIFQGTYPFRASFRDNEDLVIFTHLIITNFWFWDSSQSLESAKFHFSFNGIYYCYISHQVLGQSMITWKGASRDDSDHLCSVWLYPPPPPP